MRNMFGATTLGDGDCSAREVFGEDGEEDDLEALGVEEVSLRRSSVASSSSSVEDVCSDGISLLVLLSEFRNDL